MEMFNSVMTVSEDTLFLKRQILRSEVKEMVPYSKTIIDYPGVVSWTKWTWLVLPLVSYFSLEDL